LNETGDSSLIGFQLHDFGYRGVSSSETAGIGAASPLVNFMGTDTVAGIILAMEYYHSEMVGFSIPASEHSTITSWGKEGEMKAYKNLLEVYPEGPVACVSDSFDIFNACGNIWGTQLKDMVTSRNGKLVIRPDSGDPVDIICGEDRSKAMLPIAKGNEAPSDKGVIELLWDVFSGTINEQGYKVLDPHIGAIYGDSITIERADEICRRLESKGFASTNVVLGIGSFTYQYNTRDTFGFAMKATYVEVKSEPYDGMVGRHIVTEKFGKYENYWVESREIFKDPITDDGTKKSATGLLYVEEMYPGKIGLYDKVTWNTEDTGLLQPIYVDGEFMNTTTLTEIRDRVKTSL
jgi:nicotinamide phosphoribosyltransferase